MLIASIILFAGSKRLQLSRSPLGQGCMQIRFFLLLMLFLLLVVVVVLLLLALPVHPGGLGIGIRFMGVAHIASYQRFGLQWVISPPSVFAGKFLP